MGVMDFFTAPTPSDGGFSVPSIGGGGLGGLVDAGLGIFGSIFSERASREARRAAEAVATSSRPSTIFSVPQQQPIPVQMQTGAHVPTSAPFTFQEAAVANEFGPAAIISQVGRILRNPAVQGALGGAVGATAVLPDQQSLEVSGVSQVATRNCGVHMGSLFHQTPTGRMAANKVSLIPDGQGGAGFFVNAGCPTAWSKISLKKRHTHRSHHRPR